MEEVPRRTSLAPLASPLFCTLFNRGGNRSLLDYQEGGNHFHCAMEPLPGHIQCRSLRMEVRDKIR